MKKEQFLQELKNTLVKSGVKDIDDIVLEYSQHFDYKISDGYTEEEISAKLGDPKTVASQFTENAVLKNTNKGRTIATYAGVLFISFWAVILTIMITSISIMAIPSMALGSLLFAFIAITGIKVENKEIPLLEMPFASELFFSITAVCFSVLLVTISIYCVLHIIQGIKAYTRFIRNTVASIHGKPVLPSLPIYPQIKGKTRRILRSILIISFALFAAMFVISFITAAIQAGDIEFWNVWGLFKEK